MDSGNLMLLTSLDLCVTRQVAERQAASDILANDKPTTTFGQQQVDRQNWLTTVR